MKLFIKALISSFILISSASNASVIEFNLADIVSHGGSSQDVDSNNTVSLDMSTLTLADNTWSSLLGSFVITSETVLSFEFLTSDLGELHGIGFANNASIASGTSFILAGTQNNWGIQDLEISSLVLNQWYSLSINVGDFFTGSFDRLVFINDIDANGQSANSSFRNVFVGVPVAVTEPSVIVLMLFGLAGMLVRRKA